MSLPHAIWLRFREGDADAFARLVETYEPKIRAIAARYFRSIFDQEEAMQEIWVHLHRNREALDPERLDACEGWIATVARHRCLDLVRKLGRQPAARGDSNPEQLECQAASQGEYPGEQREMRDAVASFKSKLDPQWKEFFELCFVQGLPYADIAAKLSISKLRCKYMKKVLVGRARKNRQLLEALGRWSTSEKDSAS